VVQVADQLRVELVELLGFLDFLPAAVDDGHPVRAHTVELTVAPRHEGRAAEVGVQQHHGQQVAGGPTRPRGFEDGEIGSSEQVSRPALLSLAELEARLAEQRGPGQLAGKDDAVVLVGAPDDALEVAGHVLEVAGEGLVDSVLVAVVAELSSPRIQGEGVGARAPFGTQGGKAGPVANRVD
jgi:hypothetical protein